jgi:hypothetical protein
MGIFQILLARAAGHCMCILDRMFQRGWKDNRSRSADLVGLE